MYLYMKNFKIKELEKANLLLLEKLKSLGLSFDQNQENVAYYTNGINFRFNHMCLYVIENELTRLNHEIEMDNNKIGWLKRKS